MLARNLVTVMGVLSCSPSIASAQIRYEVQDLGSLAPGGFTTATDINAAGTVVGASEDSIGLTRPVAWRAGHVVELPVLDDMAASGEPLAVNEKAEIVGGCFDPASGYQRAVLWRDGVIFNLGSLNDKASRALDVNDSGQVVGQSDQISSAGGRAFLWTDGALLDLNALIDPSSGWELYEASGITNDGRIVGKGRNPQGILHAFLLTPIE